MRGAFRHAGIFELPPAACIRHSRDRYGASRVERSSRLVRRLYSGLTETTPVPSFNAAIRANTWRVPPLLSVH